MAFQGGRADASHVLVLFTDGEVDQVSSLYSSLDQAVDAGVRVIPVSIGNGVDTMNELFGAGRRFVRGPGSDYPLPFALTDPVSAVADKLSDLIQQL